MSKLPSNPLSKLRLLTSTDSNEDAAVLRLPDGIENKGLVQTLDFFTPVVNDPYAFGRIAAANALSDVYAMGAVPWCAMNIVCFSPDDLPQDILEGMMEGGADALKEAETVLAGGHSVDDPEIKFGLSVTGFVDLDSFATNNALETGDKLVLTKALGTGVLATAIKANWEGQEEFEALLIKTAGRLNAGPAKVIRDYKIKAATDVTGFGLGGHLLEMALSSDKCIKLWAKDIPLLPHTAKLASIGLLPAGSHKNRAHNAKETFVGESVDPIILDLVFDAQTSGGIVLAVPDAKLDDLIKNLWDLGDEAYCIGEVTKYQEGPHLHLI